jgi:hypothetical protein
MIQQLFKRSPAAPAGAGMSQSDISTHRIGNRPNRLSTNFWGRWRTSCAAH